ncbi:MAG: hypothetical protein WAR39_00125 [Prevotella sp.]
MMKNTLKFFLFCLVVFSVSSCSLIAPGEIENPNVSENTFLETDNAMETWVNGTEKSFALAIGDFCLQTEIISDNYFNNYTRENKVFDIPELLNTDPDIAELQRWVGNLRESADYGISTVQQHDKKTTHEQLFKLYYIKAYAYILAGENFIALPIADGGEVKTWQEQLKLAIPTLEQALQYAASDDDRAFIHTLNARVYYRLGLTDQAISESQTALQLSKDLVKQVKFDGPNGVSSAIQDVVWKTMYQPLPRLDFLDPKYFQLKSTDECPISIAKAEENYLILAEGLLAKGQLENSKQQLKDLIALIKTRPIQWQLNDQLEGRYNGGFKHFPDRSDYLVAASPTDEYRKGLVLDRKPPFLINVPTLSGTSVTPKMVDSSSDTDQLLALIYLMRQEVFMAEGRRMNDLGIRLPISDVEAAHNEAAKPYTQAQIPSFIPLGQGMDAFTMDTENHLITIQYNMNKVIVENKNSEFVVPFF